MNINIVIKVMVPHVTEVPNIRLGFSSALELLLQAKSIHSRSVHTKDNNYNDNCNYKVLIIMAQRNNIVGISFRMILFLFFL